MIEIILNSHHSSLKEKKDVFHNKTSPLQMNLDVIYGDTDSIMVNSNCTDIEQVTKLGNKVCKMVIFLESFNVKV